VRENDSQKHRFTSNNFLAANLQLVCVVYGEPVILLVLVKSIQFGSNPLGRYIGQQKGHRDQAGLWLAVSLYNEDLTIACDAIKHFAGRASQFHHRQSLEVDFQSSSISA
jgi:hypothetical protein